ncbi:MAG: cytochrome c [Deltaproteobacteria bacterium]|nr:cytochrome c [Deltaproteobacteria bacterium]MBI3390144.1 cytochrome c [Deltaproteobacteria bacterium]
MRVVHSLVCAIVLVGAPTLLHVTPAAAEDAAFAKAKENYQSYCRKCHGDEGKGDGPGASMLNPKPRDYTDCKVMKDKKDDELIKVVSEGGDSIGMSADMQPWGGTLSEEEIKGLVKYVRGFCKEP